MPSHSQPVTKSIKQQLPPAAPVPSPLQTAACRNWPLQYVEWCRQHIGERFTIYPVGMPPLVFLSNPTHIRAVVSAPPDVLHPGAGSAVIAPLIGERAFILCEEDDHLCGRNASVPSFHRKMVEQQVSLVEDTVNEEIAEWPRGTSFPSHPYIRAVTLKAVLRAMFPREPATLISNLHRAVLQMLQITASPLLQLPKLRRVPGCRSTWRDFVRDRAVVDDILIERITARRRSDNDDHDLLDALLAAQNPDQTPLSDRQVRDHLMSMIVAGHETTAAELAWAFQMLAHNPQVQDTLIARTREGDESYLTATLQETLRHRPAFLFAIPREVVSHFETHGYAYPSGAHLVPCTYLMHHNPHLYRDPQNFRPERFIEEQPQAGTFMPWGAGRKRCIGRHFALLEMQALLRSLLATARIEPASPSPERPRWRSAILVPSAECRIVLQRLK